MKFQAAAFYLLSVRTPIEGLNFESVFGWTTQATTNTNQRDNFLDTLPNKTQLVIDFRNIITKFHGQDLPPG